MNRHAWMWAGAVLVGALVAISGCDRAAGSGTNSGGTAAGNRGADARPIMIGHVARLQGDAAVFGISSKAGADLAAEEINKAGGVNGRPIVIITEDNKGIATDSAKLLEKLVTENGVVAILGEVASSATLNMAPRAKQLQVPQLTAAATSDELAEPQYDWTFRACFKDSFQGAVIARFAGKQLNAKRGAIIFARGNAYSEGLMKNVAQTYPSTGGEIVATESYGPDDRDYSALLSKIKSANPDVVFATGYYPEVSRLLIQARAMGITVPFIGGDGWVGPSLLPIAGEAANGCFYSDHYASDVPTEKSKTFTAAMHAKYGDAQAADSFAALSYDAVYILAEALKKNPDDPTAIREGLSQIKGFEGVTGVMTMGPDRSMQKNAVIMAIEDGKIRYHATVHP